MSKPTGTVNSTTRYVCLIVLAALIALAGAGPSIAARGPTASERATIQQALYTYFRPKGITVKTPVAIRVTTISAYRGRFARANFGALKRDRDIGRASIIFTRTDSGPHFIRAWEVASGPGTSEVGCDIPLADLPEPFWRRVLTDLGVDVDGECLGR